MTEQEATDKLEQLVGGVDRCFRLMRIYQKSVQSTPINHPNQRKCHSTEELFTKLARKENYSIAAIDHYLNHIR